MDEDDFFAMMPEHQRLQHHHLGGEGGGGGPYGPGYGGHSPATKNKYYGLSAVASADHDDHSSPAKNAQLKDIHLAETIPLKRNGVPKWQQHPPHRTRLSYGEPASPFRVIRHSQTWDHHAQSSPLRQPILYNIKENPGDLRQTSSFDPWSPPVVGRRQQVPPLGSNGSGRVKPFRIDDSSGLDDREGQIDGAGEQDGEEKDWKVRILSKNVFSEASLRFDSHSQTLLFHHCTLSEFHWFL